VPEATQYSSGFVALRFSRLAILEPGLSSTPKRDISTSSMPITSASVEEIKDGISAGGLVINGRGEALLIGKGHRFITDW